MADLPPCSPASVKERKSVYRQENDGREEEQVHGETDHRVPQTGRGGSVGGAVPGLAGRGLVLQNNAGDDLAIGADGSFSFVTSLDDGADYGVTVKTQPTALQACVAKQAFWDGRGAAVSSVTVNCSEAGYDRFGFAANERSNKLTTYTVSPWQFVGSPPGRHTPARDRASLGESSTPASTPVPYTGRHRMFAGPVTLLRWATQYHAPAAFSNWHRANSACSRRDSNVTPQDRISRRSDASQLAARLRARCPG